MDNRKLKELADKLTANVERVIVGKRDIIRNLFICLVCSGHVLLEDVPGTGKTLLAKTLSRSLDLEFSRIQFTPDLLPSDVTGIHYYDQKKGDFVFRKGPVFTNILLADEINRATPRTQSSLLECMEERQVSTDGKTYPLSPPFMVIATQNPVETLGTFPLPEAQLDRFLMKLYMGYPDTAEGVEILKRFRYEDPLSSIAPVAGKEDFEGLNDIFRNTYVSDDIYSYIIQIVEATRKHHEVILGVSPRGSQALLKTSQALAAINGRDYVTPDDVKQMAIPVLAHRIIARHSGSENGKPVTHSIIEQILQRVPVPSEDRLKEQAGA
ncbi:ATPase associated with various cellular activities [Thermoclostridium stercorarium subsp. stercorarium DSM 8532]|uniref:ATPase associated with various cellular activities n=3 Tax=Thermoclostridium stercorarium TaxID=1510 RepID=L7VGV5_THES1|nr:MoxR family ATPase [Thermoclostridium stercorarium]AGC67195.1 ATPase associated with various cellular activities [Thermoclostridium stercorarium subsp. stercorarium DSM 8532]UZQ85787.1 MoxR family ATPase [Thermoclostridium stercorarium]